MSYTIVLSLLAAIVVPILLAVLSLFQSPLRKVPSPPNTNLILGHFDAIRKEDTGVTTRAYSQMMPFGIFRTRMFLSWRVWVTDPKALSKILVTSAYDYQKPPSTRDFLTVLLGKGVLVAEGLEHKKQRRALDSAFSLPRIKEITNIFWGPGRNLVKIWEDMAPSTDEAVRIDVMPWLSRTTLDIIGLAGFDHDFDSLHKPEDKLAKAYNSLFNGERVPLSVMILSGLAEYFSPALWIRNQLPFFHHIKKHRMIVEGITQELLDKKRASIHSSDKKDILSILVRDNLGSEDPLTDKEIMDQCLTFLAAGHETTSTALTWTLQRLAENPNIQQKLRQEILQTFPQDRDLTYDELNSLPYLSAVTREVLRLDAPVPVTSRQPVKDDVICGYAIPKGTIVLIPPSVVHYHPDIWGPEADKFKPERFLEVGGVSDVAKGEVNGENERLRRAGPYANLTFLAGPKNCIGHKFALTEMKALLVCIIRNFSFEEDEPGKVIGRRASLVMRPKEGHLYLKMKRIR
ncbi:hypothetical protein PROFUN_03261 [Planoprotostelium fungivorum]|uniref:Cytochrome P450 n=1 Tax=Planoprotostelium fungivorum TaxID=1890364 RepID=A0A2P6NWK6_9EUKA|nr:hypothetical protein PROFUN_03261 [Planoprotostelium fungivorum]